MTSKKQTNVVTSGHAQQLLDLIPRMPLLPGEDAAAFADLRDALLGELAPATPYQIFIAENIVAVEWEIHRHRNFRDGLQRSSFRAVARDLRMGNDDLFGITSISASDTAKEFAAGLMRAPGSDEEPAQQWLSDQNITTGEIKAEAYNRVARALEPHEQKLAELETRRRRLRQDFDALKQAQPADIPDAEIVDEA